MTKVLRGFKAHLVSALLLLGCGDGTVIQSDEVGQYTADVVMDTAPTYTIRGVASGKCVQIVGGSTANVAAAEIRTCNGSRAQQFRLELVTGERYAIRNVQSNKCLDVLEYSTANAAPIIQYDCVKDVNQQWTFNGVNGAYGITAYHSGKALDVNGASTADGARLIQYSWHGGNNQLFRLVSESGNGTGGTGGTSGGGGSGGTSGSGATGGSGGDRCDVAVFNPSSPPRALPVTGNLGTHDPALIQAHGQYYLFQTGRGIGAKTSTDLINWRAVPTVFSSNPAWIAQQVPGATDLWAPDISYFGGQYHLYYSASTFGSNRSCIGHATRTALNAGSWTDRGAVICSNPPGTRHDWNAIDPNVVLDTSGTPWLSFGSFWSGLKLVRLNQQGTRADQTLHSIAARPNAGGAVEAPFIVRRCGYYYLFASFDSCCRGSDSTYKTVVGRSTSITGPYVDRQGVPMLQGGGTLLLQGNSRWRGPGHNAVVFTSNGAYNVYHAYDANNNGAALLRVSDLVWDSQGWPISGGP